MNIVILYYLIIMTIINTLNSIILGLGIGFRLVNNYPIIVTVDKCFQLIDKLHDQQTTPLCLC